MLFLFFLVAISCSVISQTPSLLGTGIGELLKMTWVLPFFSLFVSKKVQLSNKMVRIYIVFVLCFLMYSLIMQTFVGNYFGADQRNVCISMMIFLTSYFFWSSNRNEKMIIIWTLLLFTSVVSLIIYKKFLAISSIQDIQYAYASKNSISLMILAVTIVSFLIEMLFQRSILPCCMGLLFFLYFYYFY